MDGGRAVDGVRGSAVVGDVHMVTLKLKRPMPATRRASVQSQDRYNAIMGRFAQIHRNEKIARPWLGRSKWLYAGGEILMRGIDVN